MTSYTHSAFWAGLSHISSITSMLLRNIIFARLLSPENFAVALTFGVVLTLFEFISNFGYENLMQRSVNGDHEDFQATLHSAMIIRGIVIAAFIIIIAPYIPVLLNISNSIFNYALQRQQNFKVTAIIGLISDSLSVLVAVIFALLIQDYWAFYISFVFRHSIGTVLSHIYATRSYQLSLQKSHLIELWHFGMPLILIGFLKYFGTELDKALITRYLGLEQFTIYFLSLMLVSNSTNIISIGLAKIFIRRASLAPQNSLNKVAFGNGIISLYLAFPLFLFICFFGEMLIRLIFGTHYELPAYLITTVIALVSARFLARWLAQIVLGASNTKLMLVSDFTKVIALTASLYISITYFEMKNAHVFIFLFTACELLYIATLATLLASRIRGIAITTLKFTLLCASFNIALYYTYTIFNDQALVYKVLACGLLTSLLIIMFNVFSIQCRNQTKNLLSTAFKQ